MLPEVWVIVVVVIVVFLSRTVEGIMGFGGTVLGLAALAVLTPQLELSTTLVPMLALGGLVSCIGIVWVGRRDIVWAEFLRVAGWMLPGLPLGFLFVGYAPEYVVRLVLGVFVLALATFALVRVNHYTPSANPHQCSLLRRIYLRAMVLGAGIIHGMFATGGPMLVIYATYVLQTKGLFRVTIALTWLTLTPLLIAGWVADQRMTAEAWLLGAISAPIIIAAIWVGNILHHRLNEVAFRKVAYVLLIVAGISLIQRSVHMMLQTSGV